jgi:hypothetical protein
MDMEVSRGESIRSAESIWEVGEWLFLFFWFVLWVDAIVVLDNDVMDWMGVSAWDG